jgi:hypothetical protein
MDGPRRSGPRPTDPVAGSRTWRPALGYLAIALGIVAGGLAYGSYCLMSSPVPAPDDASTRASLPIAASDSAPAAPVQTAAAASSPAPAAPVRVAATTSGLAPAEVQQVSRKRDPNGDLTPDISDFINNGERPPMAEVIDRLHQAGVYAGLGAFSPPGTRPPLVGLAVPEDFVLPEGYVRHHQATDDGQRIEPILMFSPDHQLLDAAGRPIAMPKDRVVPPELAPPGLAVRRIVIPAPTEPGRPGN